MPIDDEIRKLGLGLERSTDPIQAGWVENVRRLFETLNQEILDAAPLKTGELKQETKVLPVNITRNKVTFSLQTASYYKFTDQGVQGKKGGSSKAGYKFGNKKPPVEDLEQWANITGWNKWALQNTIFNYGIKGTGWYSNVVTEARLDKLTDDISEAIKKSILE